MKYPFIVSMKYVRGGLSNSTEFIAAAESAEHLTALVPLIMTARDPLTRIVNLKITQIPALDWNTTALMCKEYLHE